uniref:Uncharacterized protein n=1 Tax=Amblyomma triste TaxID=251400 RepID=A0A023G5I3_AMBTT
MCNSDWAVKAGLGGTFYQALDHVILRGLIVWRFSKAHRAQFVRAFRHLTEEQRSEVFPGQRERWRVQRVVEALENFPTQTVRSMAQLIGMSKTRVYETLRDAFFKLEEYGYD